MISPATIQTLEMLRRAPRGLPVPCPTKKPVGGRPNPCALYEEPTHGAALARDARIRAGRASTTCGHVQASHPGDLAHRFVEAVECGKIPVGVPMTGSELRRKLGGEKNFCGGWENVAVTLASGRHPVRIVTLPGSGDRSLFRVELR
jgi:hypothetical protein